jgi:adenylate cyclase
MARLILATAEGGQQAIELLRGNSLGRHPNNSIQLLDKIVSKEHCLIEQRGEHFVLRDLGSLNGTYINGERVRVEGVLKHGDEIALGATRARFDDGSGRPLASSYLPPSPGWQQTASIPGHAPSGPAAPSAPSAVSDMTYRNPAVLPGSLEDPTTAVRHGGTPSPGFAQADARPGFAQAEARPGFAQPEARPGFAQAEARPGFAQPEARPGFAHRYASPHAVPSAPR